MAHPAAGSRLLAAAVCFVRTPQPPPDRRTRNAGFALWRADAAKGDVRGPEAEQVRTRDHAPGPAPAAWRVRSVKLDADVCQPGQIPKAITRGRVKHNLGDA